ncbi:MAG TPA: pilin [Candidatus Dojkabacteria bacterium]|nr:pilin [Candidatus Dojkabacteria bacterium]
MKKLSNVLAKVGTYAASAGSMLYFASATMAASASDYVGGVQTAGNGGNLIDFIQNALNLVIALAALISVGVLVYSGVQYILASGDDGKIEKATKGITYAIIGLVICFISVLIVNFVLTELLKA